VESFERTLAFVLDGDRPFLVVSDHIRTDAPATFDWLLHARQRMEVDSRTGAVAIASGQARCLVRLRSSIPAKFSQTGAFPVRPDERASGFPDQWHLTARTAAPRAEVKFVAVLVPYRAGEAMPNIEPIEGSRAAGFRVGRSQVAAWWGDGETGPIQAGEVRGEGRLAVRTPAAGDQVIVSR
jgi:hypothetical protein